MTTLYQTLMIVDGVKMESDECDKKTLAECSLWLHYGDKYNYVGLKVIWKELTLEIGWCCCCCCYIEKCNLKLLCSVKVLWAWAHPIAVKRLMKGGNQGPLRTFCNIFREILGSYRGKCFHRVHEYFYNTIIHCIFATVSSSTCSPNLLF